MRTIHVPTGAPYEVHVERGLLRSCGALLTETTRARRFAIVSDDTVFALYGETLKSAIQEAGAEAAAFVFPHGEASKSHETLLSLYAFLCENQITRTDALIALGGGVTGDLTGFAAATYLRGLPYVQIPTTLLAQVDSSVGGKTAVNLPAGKNLVGAFYQPKCVICDPETLSTLPAEEFACGMAEVIKYGMIRDSRLFDTLCAHTVDTIYSVLDEIIARCIEIKRDLVAEDEFDTGARMLLNFGHTIGHAIERYTDFAWSHGQAVAAGMALISRRTADDSVTARLCRCLEQYQLPTESPAAMTELLPLCANDKKRTGAKLTYVACETVGNGTLRKVSVEEFMTAMK